MLLGMNFWYRGNIYLTTLMIAKILALIYVQK